MEIPQRSFISVYDPKSYIRDEVRKLKNRKNVAAQSVIPKRPAEKRAFMTIFLGSCILMLTLFTLGGMVVKHGNVFADVRVTQSQRPTQPVRLPEQHMSQRDGDTLADRVDSVESKVKLWTYRQWLMSLAINENANVSKGIERSRGNPNAGFITFDEAWRMSKTPETMNLTQEQRDRIHNGG